jgi:non-heme chloroperoxidase
MTDTISVNGLSLTRARAVPSGKRRPPVLFLHGLFAGAWAFGEWQRLFADSGYEGWALDLRGHGASRPVASVGRVPFSAYVEDALEGARHLAAAAGANPVVIGHSLGGLLAQKVAEAGLAAAAVLLCPAPPRGIPLVGMRLFARLARYLPDLLASREVFPSRADADAVILNCVPPVQRPQLYARFVPGSGRAGRDILLGVPVDASRVRCPVLVVSASEDHFVPPRVARRVAAHYRAPFREYFGSAHLLPLEPGWEVAATEIEHWLDHALALGGHDTPGIIHLQELAHQKGKEVTLSFRDGHVVVARLIEVDFMEPSEVIYEVRSVMETGPPHLAEVKPGRVAAAPLEELSDFRVAAE